MPAGRPPLGAKLVRKLEGSRHAKRRLEIILETLSGTRSIASACETLGIGETAFHKLRARTLQEAVEGLEPRPVGRPAEQTDARDEQITQLESELEAARLELKLARVREELARSIPSLNRREKKTPERRGRRG